MRQINRAAVLGAGVMGATIAAHLANAGLDVLLLDIVPRELTDAEEKAGLSLTSPQVRNRIAANGLDAVTQMKPAAFHHKKFARQIEVGNFEDDAVKLRECDWIVEVVIENMAIKNASLPKRSYRIWLKERSCRPTPVDCRSTKWPRGYRPKCARIFGHAFL